MRLCLLPLLLLLAACASEPDTAPGGVTAEESEALNDAAAMLDNQSLLPPDNAMENPE